MRRRLTIAGMFLALIVVGVGGTLFAINRVAKRAVDSRSGPVHRFAVPTGESFLTDERAAVVARDVMSRDGYAASAWWMLEDGRTKAPDGRPDHYLVRNVVDPNQGYVVFHSPSSATPQRFVNIEMRGGEIKAQGTLGK